MRWWRWLLTVGICCTFETYTLMALLYAKLPFCSYLFIPRSAWLSMKYDLRFSLSLVCCSFSSFDGLGRVCSHFYNLDKKCCKRTQIGPCHCRWPQRLQIA